MNFVRLIIGGQKMKKNIFCLLLTLLIGIGAFNISVPVRDDKKPIVVDKMCYAEEIVEYEGEDESKIEITESEDDEECDECVSICVQGKSITSFSPDKATIFAVIENIDTEMTNSKELNYTSFDKVVSALKDAGLNEDQICLEYFSCCPSYDYTSGRTLQGYMTSTSFTVKVDDISNIKTIVDVMTKNGVTSVCNIQYELSTMEEEYSNALTQAYENAKIKAQKLLGEEKLKLVKIKEEMVFSRNNILRSYVEGSSSNLVGKIEIEARVFAEFEGVEGKAV